MFTAVRHFAATWKHESSSTARVLEALTEEALGQRVTPEHRSLGELAWHVVVSPKVILSKVGIEFEGPTKVDPVPASLDDLRSAHARAAERLATAVGDAWSDDDLREKVDFYGMSVPRGVALSVMLFHEIHHRGQMTVLMRQAGLDLPRIYG